jgi:uncharacterized protein
MQRGRLYRNHECIVPVAYGAFSWGARAKGLLFRQPLEADGSEAVLLMPCSSIHTFGMRYGLDIVFLDTDCCVLSVRTNVKPWRIRICRGAYATLELRAGAAAKLAIQPGEKLKWLPCP